MNRLKELLEQHGAKFDSKGSCRCLFHNDSRPSAGIFLKGDKMYYKCLACGVKGDYIAIKARLEGRSNSEVFREEMRKDKKIEKKHGLQLKQFLNLTTILPIMDMLKLEVMSLVRLYCGSMNLIESDLSNL